jgi:hypothetical protein
MPACACEVSDPPGLTPWHRRAMGSDPEGLTPPARRLVHLRRIVPYVLGDLPRCRGRACPDHPAHSLLRRLRSDGSSDKPEDDMWMPSVSRSRKFARLEEVGCRRLPQSHLSPVSGLCHHAPAAALTGRLDPTPDVAAAGAWMKPVGVEIQEAWRPTPSCVPQQCRALRRSHWRIRRHVDPVRVERQGSGGSRNAGRAQNRRTRVPKGNPRDREVPESPQGSLGGFRSLLGPQGPAVAE